MEYLTLSQWMDTKARKWTSADGVWEVTYHTPGMTIPASWRVFKNGMLEFKTMEHREVLNAIGSEIVGTVTE